MTDYSSWAEKHGQTTSLLLDPRNPRIPPGLPAVGERELIAELVEHDNVYDLAKNVVENGYSPLESLVGLQEGKKTIILEGNRRLAAMKLLISPELATGEKEGKRFRRLSENFDSESIKKVRVLYAPSREAAAPLIMQKHTRDQVERWSVPMQARFFKSLAAGGLTAQELATRYRMAPGEVAQFLRTDTMYGVACAMELPPDLKNVVRDPRKFNTSVLQRLIEIPKAREFLGISFDENGQLKGTVHADEFRKAFKRILSDIVRNVVNTRKLNSVEDTDKYLSNIASDAPDKSRRGQFTGEDLKKGLTPEPWRRAESPMAAKTKHQRVSKSLIPTGMKCSVANQKIREVFDELRTLRVDRLPNTSAAMLRILLELAIGNYLEKTGKIKVLLVREKKRQGWYPSWKNMLQAMLQDPEVVINTMAKRRLQRLVSDTNYSALDGYVHNTFVSAESRDLRDLAGAMEDIFELVLRDPPRRPHPPTQ